MLNSAQNHQNLQFATQFNSPVGYQQKNLHTNSFGASPQYPDTISPFNKNSGNQ